MPAVIVTMLVVLLIAAAVIAIVAMGMQGHAREVNPDLASALEKTGRHLNGDAEPPKGLVVLFDEIDELPKADLKELPARIRSMRSARSASSAVSADLPDTEPPLDEPPLDEPPLDPQVESGVPEWAEEGSLDQLGDTVVHARLPHEPHRS